MGPSLTLAWPRASLCASLTTSSKPPAPNFQDRLRGLPELWADALQPAEDDRPHQGATAHLKGVKIAIMGCIVNGRAKWPTRTSATWGGAPGKVNLYVGKTAVKFNIP